jgi:anti-sigma B factor antagonist
VIAEGEIDASTASVLSSRVCDLAGQRPHRLIIDLAQVSFVDSAGLAGFVRIRKAVPPDCPVALRSPQRRVRQVFALTGLDRAFSFE